MLSFVFENRTLDIRRQRLRCHFIQDIKEDIRSFILEFTLVIFFFNSRILVELTFRGIKTVYFCLKEFIPKNKHIRKKVGHKFDFYIYAKVILL